VISEFQMLIRGDERHVAAGAVGAVVGCLGMAARTFRIVEGRIASTQLFVRVVASEARQRSAALLKTRAFRYFSG
jgi:hypothetical protein